MEPSPFETTSTKFPQPKPATTNAVRIFVRELEQRMPGAEFEEVGWTAGGDYVFDLFWQTHMVHIQVITNKGDAPIFSVGASLLADDPDAFTHQADAVFGPSAVKHVVPYIRRVLFDLPD